MIFSIQQRINKKPILDSFKQLKELEKTLRNNVRLILNEEASHTDLLARLPPHYQNVIYSAVLADYVSRKIIGNF
jgi:predicted component of type VI protein secretion system